MTKTKNETILIEWNSCLFSENIYAWFDYGMIPVFSDKMEDLMLPEDYVLEPHAEGGYELFSYNREAAEYIYTGRLYAPKSVKLV
jgi:hypothetical protein